MKVNTLRVARGLDWGGGGPSSKPGCVLWGCALPLGHAHIFDEWKMIRVTVRAAAEGIKERDAQWGLASHVTFADPSLNINTGQIGESIGLTFGRYGVPLVYPSNDRLSGWQRVHEALAPCRHPECMSAEYPEGRPWLTIASRCKYLLRTLPLMIQDDHNPEDLDTDSDDHAVDPLRYLLMGGLRSGSSIVAPLPAVEPYSLAWFRRRFRAEPQGVLA